MMGRAFLDISRAPESGEHLEKLKREVREGGRKEGRVKVKQ